MEMEEDTGFISYLEILRPRRKPHIVEKKPDGIYSPSYVRNGETNPSFVRKPKRKRIEHDSSTKEVVLKKSGGETALFKQDLVPLRKRVKENKEGLRGKKLVSRGSDDRVYDSDYFKFLRHLKVLETGIAIEVGDEVIVRYEEVYDTVHELVPENYSFEERENMEGKDVLVPESMEKDLYLEAEAREKTVNKDTLLGGVDKDNEIGQIGMTSWSFEKPAIQSENDSVTAQVVGCAGVSAKTDNKILIMKQKVVESASPKANQSEKMEIDPGQASHQSDGVDPDLQLFMLLMKKLCPVEKTKYPDFNGNEVVMRPTGEPSTGESLEKEPNQDKKRETSSSSPKGFSDFDWIEEKREEEVPAEKLNLRCKVNRRGHIEMRGLAACPDLSDSDTEPQIDEVPKKILCRPYSDYRDRLIEELRRPYDKSEYRELMNEATLRKRKIIYKQLRSGERAMETNEESKSFLDWYPEVRSKVEKAKGAHRLTLLRGLFFWLENCCCNGSFKPWEKGVKSSKVHLTINDSKYLH